MKPSPHSETGILSLAFITFSLIFGLIGFYKGVEMGQTQSAENYADSHKSYAADKIQSTCVHMDAALISECIEKAIHASVENQRAEKDLAAQQNMAFYALWLLAISTLTTGITAFGVWYVRRTLVETSEAVRAADDAVAVTREIGRKQTRAYVVVSEPSIDFKDVGGTQFLIVKIVFKNTGQTPAMKFGATFSAHFGWEDEEPTLERPAGSAPLGPQDTFEISAETPNSFIICDTNGRISIERPIRIWGRAEYVDAFDDDRFVEFNYTAKVSSSGGYAFLTPAEEGNKVN